MQLLTIAVKLFGVGGKTYPRITPGFDAVKALQQYMDKILLENLAL